MLSEKIILQANGTILSTDLVSIINTFRLDEGNITKLQHTDLMKKIRKEVETLKKAGLEGVGNFSESSYINSQNKKQPCFSLNRYGMLEMLNSESVYCRAKTIEYINKLEMENKTGQVHKQLTAIEQLQLQNQAILEVNTKTLVLDSRITNSEDRITTLEERMTIETGKQRVLQQLVNKKVIAILGGTDTPAYKELSKKAFSKCWHDYKNIMQVGSYKDTPVKDFDIAKQMIIDWKPNRELELMIKGCNTQIRM